MENSVKLFSTLKIRDCELPNRVVVAPMHQYAGVDGFANDWHLMNAGRFAAGGVGLVMMESTKVERRGCGTVGDLGLWDDCFIPGLARIAGFIQQCGAKAGIQLGHSGRKARCMRPWEGGRPIDADSDTARSVKDWDDWELVAPSALYRCRQQSVVRLPRDAYNAPYALSGLAECQPLRRIAG
ncbi:MAG: hypothetical protein ACK5DS_04535 [Burkholderiales bacterium]